MTAAAERIQPFLEDTGLAPPPPGAGFKLMFIYAIKALVSIPLSLFLLAALGALLWRWKRRSGPWILGGAVTALVALSIPMVAAVLMGSLQTIPALTDMSALDEVDAIVILAGDYRTHAAEYDAPAVGPLSLERVRYGAHLARQSKLPLLVTGGVLAQGSRSIARAMRSVLQRELGVTVKWVEEQSKTTWENAQFSHDMLAADQIERVAIVTHAWHMPRARQAFRKAGFEVTCAPTAFQTTPHMRPGAFVPSAKALLESSWAVHEWLGRLWYSLRS